MDGCPHCVAIIGIWNAVVGKMREQHKNYFNIDVERENADIATEFLKKNKGAVGLEVSSFPTIYVIKSGKTFFYNGERTVENIVNWIIQPEKNYI
jgi:thiol-disulfide isomerase/thioredoxin